MREPGLVEDALARVIEKGLDARGVPHRRSESIHEYGCTIEVDYGDRTYVIEVRDVDDEVV